MSTSRTVAHNKEQNQHRGTLVFVWVPLMWVPLILCPVDDVEASSRDVVMDLLKLLFVKSACSVVSIRLRNNSHAPDRAVNRSFLVVLIYAYVQLYLAMISRALLRSYVLLCVLLVVGSYPLDIIVYPASLSTLGHLFTIVIVI